MGVDVYFVKKRTFGWKRDGDEEERVASIGGFFNMAHMMSQIMDAVRGAEEEEFKKGLAPFWTYVKKGRAAKRKSFNKYCRFVNGANEQMRQIVGEGASMIEGMNQTVFPEDFDPDVQAFLGGFVLGDKPIPPESVAAVMPFVGIVCGIFKHGMEQYKESEPDVANALSMAYGCLATVRDFGDRALTENRGLFFSA